MQPMRVQLGAMPAMLADLVVQLLGVRSRVEIAGRADPGEDALERARAAGADLLVVLDNPESPDGIGAVLAQPKLSILALSSSGDHGELVRLRREDVALDRRLASAVAGVIAPAAGFD